MKETFEEGYDKSGLQGKGDITIEDWVDYFKELFVSKTSPISDSKKIKIEIEDIDKEITVEGLQWGFRKLKEGQRGGQKDLDNNRSLY